MPFVTRFPGFRFRSSLLTSLRWPATPPFQSGVCRQKKSILGFFLDCRSQGLLHVANPPSMARYCLARKNKTCLQRKSILGFFRGSEICVANLRAAKSRLHALFAYWQERLKHACKEKSLHGSIFLGKKQIRSLSPSKGTFPQKTPVEKKGFLGISRNVERYGP